MNKLIRIGLSLCMAVMLSTVAFATEYTDTYDLAKDTFPENNTGNANSNADGSKAKKVLYLEDGSNYLITGTASSANEALTIEVRENATVNITLQDVKLGDAQSSTNSSAPTHYSVYRNLLNIEAGAHVTLSLEGENSLYLDSYTGPKAAIRVAPTASLTIQDGSGTGNGSLSVTSDNNGAAIGGNGYCKAGNPDKWVFYDAESNGTITIQSGNVIATSTAGSVPAIGGGFTAGNGNITISGGTVTVSAESAVGIGSGATAGNTASTGNITINGDAKVIATQCAIGSIAGTGGAIVIEGDANVTATGIGYDGGSNDITIGGDATVTAENGYGIGGGANFGTIRIQDNANVTATTDKVGQAGIGGASGDSTSGSILINTTGTVKATGGDSSAGIGVGGSGNKSISTVSVEIRNGNITATGGGMGAGIGCGQLVDCSGTVIIYGGSVTATGSADNQGNGGAGIGAGFYGDMAVTITGGIVTATGAGENEVKGADIGGASSQFYESTVTISGGMVTATTNGIGEVGGNNYDLKFSTGDNGNAVIFTSMLGTKRRDFTATNYSGIFFIDAFGDDASEQISNQPIGAVYGNPTLSQDITIPADKTLTIEGDNALTIGNGATLTNAGTLTLSNADALTGAGTLAGGGSFLLKNDVITDNMITIRNTLPTTYDSKTYALSDGHVTVTVPNNTASTLIMEMPFTTSYDIVVEADGDVTGWTRTLTLNADTEVAISNAGTYTVTYTRGNQTASKIYTVEKADVSSVALEKFDNAQYFGDHFSFKANAFGVEVSTGRFEGVSGTFKIYDTVAGGEDILLDEIETTRPTYVAYNTTTLSVGTHELYVEFTADDANYKSETKTSEPLVVRVVENTLSVDNGISTITSVYDGEQKIFMPVSVKPSGVANADEVKGYTISYKLTSDADSDYSTTPPTMVNVGTYNLSYLIQAEGYADYEDTVTYTITPAKNETNPIRPIITKPYNGLAQDPGFTWRNAPTVEGNEVTIVYSEAEITDDNPGSATLTYKDAGTYTIYYKISAENHTDDSGSFTFTIDKLTVTKTNHDLSDYTIVAGNVSFTEPSFYGEGITSEPITGTLTYAYTGGTILTKSYADFIAEMNKLPFEHGTQITIGYTFCSTGNYQGTISGNITTTVQSITFEGDMTATTATYGDTWGDILDFTQETYSAKVGNDDVTGTYTLEIEGADYDSTAISNADSYDWAVTFTSTDDTYQEISVDSGTVTVEKRIATYTWDATTFAYDGTAKLPTPTITNAVGEDTVTVTATGAETNVGDSYTAIAVLNNHNGNYALPEENPNTTFAITAVTAEGTISMSITDRDSDKILNEGDVLTMTYTHTLVGESATYQWYKNGSTIENATNASYTLTAQDAEGAIHCVVTLSGNTTGTFTGETATIGSSAPVFTAISTTRGNGTVTINWTVDNGGRDITGYSLSATYMVDEVATDVGGVYDIAATATSYTVTGLTNGTEYTFVLTATNDLGSADSEQVTGTPYQPTCSGGGGGGGSITPPTTTTEPSTEEVTKPDGTTTATTTVTVKPSVSNGQGTTSSTVKDKDIDNAIDQALETKGDDHAAQVEIKVESKKDTPKVEVSLTTSAITSVADSDVDDLTITTDIGSITMPSEAAKEIASQAGGKDVTITLEQVDNTGLTREQKTAVGDAQVYDLHITCNGKPITTFGGHSVTVTLPYELAEGESADNIVIWHLADDGTMQALEGHYDAKTGKAIFETTHFSYYVALHYNNPFADVAVEDYFFSPVMWAVEHGITNGTSATAFSPNATCTRAQAVTLLWKAYGSPVVERDNPFTDVDEGTYYYEAVLWAVENGITNGTTATTFSPNADCTRSQIVTFLWNAEKKPMVNYLMTFEDVAGETWYTEAVRWAVSEDITSGTSDTTFSPVTNCTRGQIMTFLYRNMAD